MTERIYSAQTQNTLFGENESACPHGWSLMFVIKLSDSFQEHEASAGGRKTAVALKPRAASKILKRLWRSHC